MKQRLLCLFSLLCAAGLIIVVPRLAPREARLPGAVQPRRALVRIWLVSAPGGGEDWLRDCLRAWEQAHPEVRTYLRSVSAGELAEPSAVMPDMVLYMPGNLTAPQQHFVPVTGAEGLREELLRSGRWQMEQYGLPLCWAGWALAIDSGAEPHLAQTPAPTTLLGRPAATAAPQACVTPGIPALESLACPAGCGLFALGSLYPAATRTVQADVSAAPGEAFRLFRGQQVSAALLTTGQIAALEGTRPFRAIVPQAVVTDQVWLASLLPGADAHTAALLQHLISPASQRLLSARQLHTVRDDLRLYASGTPMLIESAAARSLAAVSAYVPRQDVESAAWQFDQGRISLDEALLPLM